MAQKEIVLQQVRTGKQRDLPVALELGQIGFSSDVGRVFIGLPSSSEPASLVAGRTWATAPNSGQENVEIITEFSPWNLINDIVNKPFRITIPANTIMTRAVQGTSRLFLEYVGFSTESGSALLESGAVQMVALNDNVLLSQQNNTNATDGLVALNFNNPVFDTGTKRMSISVDNSSDEDMIVEFILRGWDQPV